MKQYYIAEVMVSSNIDIIVLQETGHRIEDEGFLTKAFSRLGFASYWSADPLKTGLGQGVGMIVRRNIIARVIAISPGYCMRLRCQGLKKFSVVNIYWPLDTNPNHGIIRGQISQTLNNDSARTLVGGDFNQEVVGVNTRWPQFRVSSDSCHTRGRKWTCVSGTRSGISYRQIDFWLSSPAMHRHCVRAKVLRLKQLRSDHSPVKISYDYVGITGWQRPVLRFRASR